MSLDPVQVTRQITRAVRSSLKIRRKKYIHDRRYFYTTSCNSHCCFIGDIIAWVCWQLINLPISQYPEISPATVQITSTFNGADAQTVEQTVTTPIETQVNGTPGMAYMQSNSTSSGQTTITVTYNVGADVTSGALDIQNRVGIATPSLPNDVKQLGITTRKRNPSILMLVAMYSPNGSHDVTFIDNYTNIFVKNALLRVKGVGDIFTRADDFSMRIWLQPDKLAQMGLTANDVVAALQEQNIQIAAGTVGAPRNKMFRHLNIQL